MFVFQGNESGLAFNAGSAGRKAEPDKFYSRNDRFMILVVPSKVLLVKVLSRYSIIGDRLIWGTVHKNRAWVMSSSL